MSEMALAATEIDRLLPQLAARLLANKLWLATAESCTGGGISYYLTEISGSSQWFDCAFVTYSNSAKQTMLGVGLDTLKIHGAVSAATVQAMAQGALLRSRADLSVAVSGVAGPTGGSADKPVGLVWFAFAKRQGGQIQSREEPQVFLGNRHAIRLQTIAYAIQGVLAVLDSHQAVSL